MDCAWWGRRALEDGQQARVRAGTLELSLSASDGDWHLHLDQRERTDHADLGLGPRTERTHSAARELVLRFGTRPPEFEIVPAMPPRAVISRPAAPLGVPPRQSAVLYLTTPLWLMLRAPDHPGVLLDVPTERLSDTWFGASTRSGELCFASRVEARSHPGARVAAHVAITEVTLHNRSDSVLPVERISLPARLLSLYEGADLRLWTEAVSIEHVAGHELDRVSLGTGAPARAAPGRLLAPARTRAERNIALSALSALSALLGQEPG